MTRSQALELLKNIHIPEECKIHAAFNMAMHALENKTPCSLCRHKKDTSGICDMCPAMPLERGAE